MTQAPYLHAVSAFVGRCQIFHNGQLAVLRRGLALAPKCVVVLGSAFQARTPKNPFTWQERAQMISLALTPQELDRVVFVPVRDYYDKGKWVAAVRHAVREHASERDSVVLVGHHKDATSAYLNDFPGWALEDVGVQGEIHASALRDVYFGAGGGERGGTETVLDAALAALVDQTPPSTLGFLRSWAALPFFKNLAAEWSDLKAERALWKGSPYAPVFVTVDAVVQCSARVLLIRRGRSPGRGLLALPGGFIEQRETAYQSALRELCEETGMQLRADDMQHALKAAHVFDHPDRSQRGRVITHAFHFDLGPRRSPEVRAGDDAAEASWVPLADLAGLEDQFHDDHFHILDLFFGLTQAHRPM